MCRDYTTGDYAIATWSNTTSNGGGTILRLDRNSGALSTIASGLGGITGMDYFPYRMNGFVITRSSSGAPDELLVVYPNGGLGQSRTITGANAVTVDQVRSRVFVATHGLFSPPAKITEFDDRLNAVKTRNFPGYQWHGIDVWEDQNVSVFGPGQPGTAVTGMLRFSRSANCFYGVALSFGCQWGLKIGPSRLNLNRDSLFFLTAVRDIPGLTTGFLGTLSSAGNGGFTFYIPSFLKPGTCVYVSALAVNPALPFGVDVGNVVVVR